MRTKRDSRVACFGYRIAAPGLHTLSGMGVGRQPDELDQRIAAQLTLRSAIRAWEEERGVAMVRRNDAICAAFAAGLRFHEVVAITGMSPSRLTQIRREHCRSVPEDGHETA